MGLRTLEQVRAWIVGALEEFSDPSAPVGHVIAGWQNNLRGYAGVEVACGFVDEMFCLKLVDEREGPPIQIPVQVGEHRLDAEGTLECFGAELLGLGVWLLSPSLNIPGFIHCYVVLTGVPTPAPWEKRIILL